MIVSMDIILGRMELIVMVGGELHVDLILRSNKFHGSVVIFSFTKLGILDLSDNELSGNLPVRYFENFKAMRA
ncbi:hypothetical protein FEM48_Zijuj07G0164500 [Ziziphus jujuba var. spinosa]|uniref:Uncharacterized protein n=1 Tax=Ziziphus jujuba var. spinosa TaxID=714518 RepID=A0A978V5P9_ZIZJJ|nr:hypothetical protein FEM48_Zijuj07G0164500 [Ziziphus jujuba var. spinosa]